MFAGFLHISFHHFPLLTPHAAKLQHRLSLTTTDVWQVNLNPTPSKLPPQDKILHCHGASDLRETAHFDVIAVSVMTPLIQLPI